MLFHRLVLVSEFVHLQFEEVRQILRLYRWSAATTTAAALSKGDLDIAEDGVRALQVGQRLLFAGKGVFGLAGHQQLFGGRHLDETRIEVVHDLGKLRARSDSAVPQAPGERLDLFPQAPLGQPDGGDGFGNRAGGHSLAVPENLEGGHHDLLLAHAQSAVEPIPGASASAGHGVPLPEGSVKRPDRDEEHVARGFGTGPVPRYRVVGDEVSRNEVVFLEKQRVSRLDLVPGSSGRQHLAGLFPSVDGNPHLEPPDRIVVFGEHFDEHLFYRIRLAVPSRPQESHDGRQVLENFDQVVAGRGSQVFVRPGERDPVRPRLGEREGRGQHLRARSGWRFLRCSGLEGDFHRSRLQPQDTGRRRNGGEHFQFHHGAGHGGDVPSVLDFPRAETGVVRIAVGKPDLLHVGDVFHLDPKGRREHPVRVDEIVRRLRNPEQEMPEGAVLGIGQHRDRFPNRRFLDAGPEVHPGGGEPFEPGLDPAIRVARDRRIPRLHVYPVRVRVGDVGPGREEQGGSAKQRRRSEKRSHNRHPTDGGQRAPCPPEPGGLDEATLIQRLQPAYRLHHHQPGEVGGNPVAAGTCRWASPAEFHATDHRLAERGVVLLDIERHLLIGDPETERPDHETPDGHPESKPCRRLQAPHHPRGVTQRVHRGRGDTDDEHRRDTHHGDAEDQTPGPPPGPHAPDDPQEILVGRLR